MLELPQTIPISQLGCLIPDTTVSSDTSDVEGRIEELMKKVANRRAEVTRLKKEMRRQSKQRLRAVEANLLNEIKVSALIKEYQKYLKNSAVKNSTIISLALVGRVLPCFFRFPQKYDTTISEMRKKLEMRKSCVRASDKLAIESRSVADFKVPEIPIKSIEDIYKSDELSRSQSEPVLDKKARTRVMGGRAISDTEEIPASRSTTSEDVPSEINALEQARSTKSSTREVSEHLDANSSDTGKTDNSLIFSVSSIQFHNNDLSKNISTLENDMKSLSELMSSFSKRSGEKLKSIRILSQATEIATEISGELSTENKEISEELSKQTGSNGSAIATATSAGEIVSDIEEVLSNSVSRTDYEAQSKEILNEIQQSIISESASKTTGQDTLSSQLAIEVGMQHLHEEKEALSKGLNSLEADIQAISEYLSKVSKSSSEKRDDTVNEQESYDTKTFEESKATDLIETIVDSIEDSDNSTLVQDETRTLSTESRLKLDVNDESRKVKSREEDSSLSLQDLKETDIDSSHEFDGAKEQRSDNNISDLAEEKKSPSNEKEENVCESLNAVGEKSDSENSERENSDSIIEEIIEEGEAIEEFFSEKASEENKDLARLHDSLGGGDTVLLEEEKRQEKSFSASFDGEGDFHFKVLEIGKIDEVKDTAIEKNASP